MFNFTRVTVQYDHGHFHGSLRAEVSQALVKSYMPPIKIVIADDHTLFREGLRRIFSFEQDVTVVGEASKGDDVGKVVESTKPDVLLLDIRMPKAEVLQTLREVRTKNPDTKTLILTGFSEEEIILNLAKGGARGYVLKGVDSGTLLQAIKTVNAGGVWVDRDIPAAWFFERIARGFLHC